MCDESDKFQSQVGLLNPLIINQMWYKLSGAVLTYKIYTKSFFSLFTLEKNDVVYILQVSIV